MNALFMRGATRAALHVHSRDHSSTVGIRMQRARTNDDSARIAFGKRPHIWSRPMCRGVWRM